MTSNAMTSGAVDRYVPTDSAAWAPHRRAPEPSMAIAGIINGLAISTLLWGMGLALWLAW